MNWFKKWWIARKFRAETFIVRDFDAEQEHPCGYMHYKVLGVKYTIGKHEVTADSWKKELALAMEGL